MSARRPPGALVRNNGPSHTPSDTDTQTPRPPEEKKKKQEKKSKKKKNNKKKKKIKKKTEKNARPPKWQA